MDWLYQLYMGSWFVFDFVIINVLMSVFDGFVLCQCVILDNIVNINILDYYVKCVWFEEVFVCLVDVGDGWVVVMVGILFELMCLNGNNVNFDIEIFFSIDMMLCYQFVMQVVNGLFLLMCIVMRML